MMLKENDKFTLGFPEKQEFSDRIEKLFSRMNKIGDWDAVFLIDKINQYYFTGTMQDGVFVLKKDGSSFYFARLSFERAKMECLIDHVFPMGSYKDVKNVIGENIHHIYTEIDVIPYGNLERIKKYFKIDKIDSVDKIVKDIRSVKSPYELSCIEVSGEQHHHLLENIVPGLLREGMNEAELMAELYEKMIKLGYHGVSRFSMFQTETVCGQLGFGENSLYPASFNGPGGMKGMCPAVPIIGDRKRLLKKGDLVFVDIGYGVYGYHTDRTQIYLFGAVPPDELTRTHRKCMQIQKEIASHLKPGNLPSEIYHHTMNRLEPEFLRNFMGFKDRKVKFLGHGVGLQIDEYPIIADTFDEPLVDNMVIAVEPKKGVENFGVVGGEDTYIVTDNGGKCVTKGEKDIFII